MMPYNFDEILDRIRCFFSGHQYTQPSRLFPSQYVKHTKQRMRCGKMVVFSPPDSEAKQ